MVKTSLKSRRQTYWTEGVEMTSSDPPDFNHIGLGLWQETVLWGRPPVFSLLALNNKSFLLSISGLVVPFGSTSTMRQTQFFRRHPYYSSHFRRISCNHRSFRIFLMICVFSPFLDQSVENEFYQFFWSSKKFISLHFINFLFHTSWISTLSSPSFLPPILSLTCFSFSLIFLKTWTIVNLQRCVCFKCTANNLVLRVYIYIFSFRFFSNPSSHIHWDFCKKNKSTLSTTAVGISVICIQKQFQPVYNFLFTCVFCE